jgi:hypothetical protein
MIFWASVLTTLYWLYATLASFWPLLFARDFVKASERVAQGYRIGLWKIHWRLPIQAAIIVVLLSIVPILTVVFLDGWFVPVILAIMTVIILFLWMIASPGMILGSKVLSEDDEGLALEIVSPGVNSRSILVLLLFGLLPALGIGAVLRWLLILFVI